MTNPPPTNDLNISPYQAKPPYQVCNDEEGFKIYGPSQSVEGWYKQRWHADREALALNAAHAAGYAAGVADGAKGKAELVAACKRLDELAATALALAKVAPMTTTQITLDRAAFRAWLVGEVERGASWPKTDAWCCSCPIALYLCTVYGGDRVRCGTNGRDIWIGSQRASAPEWAARFVDRYDAGEGVRKRHSPTFALAVLDSIPLDPPGAGPRRNPAPTSDTDGAGGGGLDGEQA